MDNTSYYVRLKRALVVSIYEVYAETAKNFYSQCKLECKLCCTAAVLATTIEADLIIDFLEKIGDSSIMARAITAPDRDFVRPCLSINTLAAHCLRKEQSNEEDHVKTNSGKCFFRGDDGCLIYPVRPFSCRCMWSERLCLDGSQAVMDPLLVTISGVCQQLIEDVDQGGLYGNLKDLIIFLNEQTHRTAYLNGHILKHPPELVPTVSNPGLIVPPYHRPEVTRFLNQLWEQRIYNMHFKDAVGTIKEMAAQLE